MYLKFESIRSKSDIVVPHTPFLLVPHGQNYQIDNREVEFCCCFGIKRYITREEGIPQSFYSTELSYMLCRCV